jgi:hypothetical protein
MVVMTAPAQADIPAASRPHLDAAVGQLRSAANVHSQVG